MAEIFIILELGLLTFLIIPCDYSSCLQATYKSHKSWNSSLNLEISIVWQWDVCKSLHLDFLLIDLIVAIKLY